MAALIDIDRLPAEVLAADADDLSSLLIDVVDGGASIWFVAPLAQAAADSFWQQCFQNVVAGDRIILVARDRAQAGRIVGAVQLVIGTPQNQRHRADVSKLLVLRAARGQGIAQRLMEALEQVAAAEQRSLLTLDTVKDSAADRLYRRLGYTAAGSIPEYALDGDGKLAATVLFYKQLK